MSRGRTGRGGRALHRSALLDALADVGLLPTPAPYPVVPVCDEVTPMLFQPLDDEVWLRETHGTWRDGTA